MQEQEFCFCEPDSQNRAPNEEEFQVEYEKFFEGRRLDAGDGRELQLGNIVGLSAVYRSDREAPAIPDFLAETDDEEQALIFNNPNGIFNYKNCKNLPRGTYWYIGYVCNDLVTGWLQFRKLT